MELSKQQEERCVRDLFYLEEDLKTVEQKFSQFLRDEDMGFLNRDTAIETIDE